MRERKFMIKNSKCFTNMTAHILEQLLRLLPRQETFPRSPATWLHREHVHPQAPLLFSQKSWFKSGSRMEPSQWSWMMHLQIFDKYLLSTEADYIFQRWPLPCHLSHMFYKVTLPLLISSSGLCPLLLKLGGLQGLAQSIKYGRCALMWLLRLSHRRLYSFRQALLLLESGHHAVRKPKPLWRGCRQVFQSIAPAEAPRGQPAWTTRLVSEVVLDMAPAPATVWSNHVRQPRSGRNSKMEPPSWAQSQLIKTMRNSRK